MSEISILVVNPGMLDRKNKKLLEASGVVVIETDKPEGVKFITPSAELDGSDLLFAALVALDSVAIGNEIFVRRLRDIVVAKRQAAGDEAMRP